MPWPKSKKPDVRKDVCGKCKFWVGGVENQPGECRRYPPALSQGSGDAFRNFPKTGVDQWCGEFDKK